MTRVLWSDPGLDDLAAIVAYIKADSPDAARRAANAILAAVTQLARIPESGRAGRIPGTRELVVPRSAYVVVYELSGSDAIILRVLHGAMRWPPDGWP